MKKLGKILCMDLIGTDWKWCASALVAGAFFTVSPYMFPNDSSKNNKENEKPAGLEIITNKFELLSTKKIETNDIYRIEFNMSMKKAY